jgi:hypothetical protein
MDKIERMWALGELPPSTQHASAPPTEAFVISCVRDLRTVFGEDIHWATDNDSWFVCSDCLRFALANAAGWNCERARLDAKTKQDIHTTDHRVFVVPLYLLIYVS